MAYASQRPAGSLLISPLLLCMGFVVITRWNRRTSHTGRRGISVASHHLRIVPQPLPHLLLRNTVPPAGTYYPSRPFSFPKSIPGYLSLLPYLLFGQIRTTTLYNYSHIKTMPSPTVRVPTTPDGQKSPPSNRIVSMAATVTTDQNNSEPTAAVISTTIQPALPGSTTAAAQVSPCGSDRSKDSTAVDNTASSDTSPCQSLSRNGPSDGQPLDKQAPSGHEEGRNQQSLADPPGYGKELDVELFKKHAMAEHRAGLGVDVDLEHHPRPSKAQIQEYQEAIKESYNLAPSDRKDKKYNRLLDVGEDVDEKRAIAQKQHAQMLSEHKFKKLDPAPQVYLRKNCCSTSCKCRPCWSRYPSCEEEEAALASSSVHVLLRNTPTAAGTGWETSEIVIRGQEMKDALRKVVEGYPGFEPRLMGGGDWVFPAPFMPFVHRWGRLAAHPFHWDGEHDIDSTHEVERHYMLDSISSALDRTFKEMELITATREVRFEDLWLIYTPGTIVVTELVPTGSTKLRLPEAVRVVSCSPVMSDCGGKTRLETWQVKSDVHLHNGDTLGWCTETWTLPRFEGYRRVDALGPYFPDATAMVKELHSRGKRAIESCCKFGPMWFTAKNPIMSSAGDLHESPHGPRMVMIDLDGLYKYGATMGCPNIHTRSDLLKPKSTTEQRENDPAWADPSYEKRMLDTWERSIYERRGSQVSGTDGKAKEKDEMTGSKAMRQSSLHQKRSGLSRDAHDGQAEGLLTERTVDRSGSDLLPFDEAWYSSKSTFSIEGPIIPEYLLSRGYLGGFDLVTKQWCQFSATDLEPMHDRQTDMHAVDKLYPGHQHIARIAELVRRKVDPQLNASDSKSFLDDTRKNLKLYLGRALTFLIAGPSGVGKTATVHAIAHMNKTSVWETTVDELCSSPGGFQKGLETALHLCERMNFLFLLEDADSLICQDANCKDHVAAMLQVLNKTPCVVFLTATKIDLFPDNLLSRCDKFVRLPELTRSSRRRAWLKAFKEQGVTKHILNSTQLDTALNMAEKPRLNGHEIVNMVKQVPMRAIGGFNCDGDNYVNELGRMIDEVGNTKIGLAATSLRGEGRELRTKQDLNGRQKENQGMMGKENQYSDAEENRYPMLEHEYQADGIDEETDGYEEVV